jgi:hypothetical protein
VTLLEVYSWGALVCFAGFCADDDLTPLGASLFAAAWPATALFIVYAIVWEVQRRTRLWWRRRRPT